MLNTNETLYRYISFDRFNQMLYSQKLTLISPLKWNDTYEQYWLKALNTEEGQAILSNYIVEKNSSAQRVSAYVSSLSKWIISSCYCLCFSLAKDEEVLWNAHSDSNRCIMYATTRDALCNALDGRWVSIEKVNYDLERISLFQMLTDHFPVYDDEVFSWDDNVFLLHKRSIFSYEQEVRLIFRSEQCVEAAGQVVSFPIPSLSRLICGVMVHPAATEEHVELVKTLCEKKHLPFWGKSKLYKVHSILCP